MSHLPIRLSAEVEDAQQSRRPLVALESTIITHGLPRPQNLEVAKKVESEIRMLGAVPATIAVMDGTLHVGLEDAQLQRLAEADEVAKLSRADVGACIASGGMGATTVAATMIAANVAGIEVFATGGIGGVHRGASTSFDVSADLYELGRTPVSVVAAGAKAILDLPATLEVLETLGVPVFVMEQATFPAFWSRDSGLPAPVPAPDIATVARAKLVQESLQIRVGQLVANPIDASDEIPATELAPIIEAATRSAASAGIRGKAVTPYLLSRIFEATQGRSLTANVALVLKNARLAARLAQEIAALRSR
ncbi:pseudouridine-5'-phosphate glycosidase [Roseitranquillus sediminis]|uniref:pseudouridine-5'-phosphate glycosidase n=1 Tax=Roseitranquillus sediminis TaxID=2809051 RepID=UPI001D0CD60D|nr:pseudouridine-5'-phosphate glycosidase [Roseitranquillus sediminis]MBM9595598.1 pseudouridine-5'-phosphate glycosidase [Roseitranquillus sediminis]